MARDADGMEQHGARSTALRGLVPPVLTVAVVVGAIAGARAGGGAFALVVAALVAGLVALLLGVLAAGVVTLASRPDGVRRRMPGPTVPTDDLAARWATVEPFWSGRR